MTPDIAVISLEVETNKKEMSEAQSENKELMSDIMAELKNLGIQDEDIQTNNYSVYPDYEWNNNKQILLGYKVTNTVSGDLLPPPKEAGASWDVPTTVGIITKLSPLAQRFMIFLR